MRLHTSISHAARRNVTVGIATMSADGIATGSPVRVMAKVAAAHSVVPGMDMIAVHGLAIGEIAATLRGSACVRIRKAPTDADANRRADIEAGSDRDSEVESCQTRDAYANGERRHVHFTNRQRDPAHRGFRHHHARIEIRENHQRRSIHGTNHGDWHGRHPAPGSPHIHPAAVVERRPTPRGVVDPIPAPRLNPSPMSITIGRPVGHFAGGKPHRTIRTNAAPHATLRVQIRVAGQVARNVERRRGGVFTRVPKRAKRVELVGRGHRSRIQGRILSAGGRHLRTHMYRGGLVADLDFSVTIAHRRNGGCAVFSHVHAIVAIPQQREGELGSVDLEALPGRQGVQPDVQRSSGEFDLAHPVVEVQKREIGTGAHADRCIIRLKLSQTVRLSPDVVAIGHRMVELRWNPVVDAGGLKRNGAGYISQAGDPAGRGCVVVLREGRERQQCAEG
jgi:hypothetical protein